MDEDERPGLIALAFAGTTSPRASGGATFSPLRVYFCFTSDTYPLRRVTGPTSTNAIQPTQATGDPSERIRHMAVSLP